MNTFQIEITTTTITNVSLLIIMIHFYFSNLNSTYSQSIILNIFLNYQIEDQDLLTEKLRIVKFCDK